MLKMPTNMNHISITAGQALLSLITDPALTTDKREELKKHYLVGMTQAEYEAIFSSEEYRELLRPFNIQYAIDSLYDDATRRYFETRLTLDVTNALIQTQAFDSIHQSIFSLLEQEDAELAKKLKELLEPEKTIESLFTSDEFKNLGGIIEEFIKLYLNPEHKEIYQHFNNPESAKNLIADFIILFILCSRYQNVPMNAYHDSNGLYTQTNRGKISRNNDNDAGKSTAGTLRGRDPSIDDETRFARFFPTWGCENSKPTGTGIFNEVLAQNQMPFVNSISGTFLAVVRTLLYLHQEKKLFDRLYNNEQDCMTHLKAMICAVAYITGGHSLFEYIYVLTLPKQYQLGSHDELKRLVDLLTQHQTLELMFSANQEQLSHSIDAAIAYNTTVLRKKMLCQQISSLIQSPEIFRIPNLNLDPAKVISGFGGKELGNIGFIGLKNGLTRAQLLASVRQFTKSVHSATKRISGNNDPEDGFFMINETAYADSKDPELAQKGEGKLIVTITPENIDGMVARHQFTENDSELQELNESVCVVKADAFVTNVKTYKGKQFYLTVNGAAAHSLLLCDPVKGVSAAISCSWHVFAKGIPGQVIEEMKKLGADPKNIIVQMGPGLGPDSYEFGDPKAFYDPTQKYKDGEFFVGAKEEYAKKNSEKYFIPHPKTTGKYLVNMPELVRDAMQSAGVPIENVYDNAKNWDTFKSENAERYFAARKSYPDDRAKAAERQYLEVGRNGAYITLR